MKIYDAHMHGYNSEITIDVLLSEMAKAGVFGTCIYSNAPKENLGEKGSEFEERLSEVLTLTEGHEDRVFPVLWIHPYEENILDKLHIAKSRGIKAFKIICNNFYVYDEVSMRVLREIASIDMPVIFHTGILWDGQVSSKYNRPINWEALIEIEGIRFSLAHCSWPWIDECIALYGKFLNARTYGKNVEMFFDITPGTPEIYREELLTKLYKIGYNVGDNVMFGTDSNSADYRAEWTKEWLETDRKILDKLGVSLENREKLYGMNLLRFLAKTENTVQINPPTPDNANAWSPINPKVKPIIEKWYKKLGFPKSFDKEFYSALSEYEISDAIDITTYNCECKDGKRNLLSFLFLCEKLEKEHKKLGIAEEITLDTLYDLVNWTKNYTLCKKELYLGELHWLKAHFSAKLFKLGRLQFKMATATEDVKKYGIEKGAPIIEIHIPQGEKLSIEECKRSIELAGKFFSKFFPSFNYKYMSCDSWLLDEQLSSYLSEDSNIIGFASLFDRISKKVSSSIIKYLFLWDTTPENLVYAMPTSSFSLRVKEDFLRGKIFYEVYGILKKL